MLERIKQACLCVTGDWACLECGKLVTRRDEREAVVVLRAWGAWWGTGDAATLPALVASTLEVLLRVTEAHG